MMVSTAKLLLPLVLTSALVLAQAPPASAPAAAGNEEIKIAPGTVVPAELVKSLDSKKLKEGDPVTAKVSVDMLSGGTIVVPRDSKIVGHVTEAKSRGKGESESTLGIIFDRLILKNGTEFPFHATLQAVGPPITYRMAAGADENANPSPSSTAGGGYGPRGGMPAPAANPSATRGPEDQPANVSGGKPLPTNATGVVGISGVTLRTTSASSSVLASEKKNVKLDSGSQLLLRTANP